ncbi:class F sortase [Streptomyces fragilis]|uniref:Class F sortase n=1 Tax=Streptomyces fragilis TaxID=67301 RepID=A0ABV2YH34_9ACTN|nr:class F sortase [Streptomyces fragilis]
MGERTGRLVALATTIAALAAVVGVDEGTGQAVAVPDFGPALADPSTLAPTAAAQAPAAAAPAGSPAPSLAPAPPGTAARPDRPAREEDERRAHAPLRVLVRAIGLDAQVLPVGVTRDGDMRVPSDPAVAGWYRFGPAPGGDRGSAVLAGHLDDATGALGTFALLREAEPGDQVEVWREGAEPVRYRVTARTTVPDDALPPAVFRRDGPPVLTLITCAPPFVPGEGGYRANLVVVAEPVPA